MFGALCAATEFLNVRERPVIREEREKLRALKDSSLILRTCFMSADVYIECLGMISCLTYR